MAHSGERIKSSWLRDENAPPKKQDGGVAARVTMVVILTLTLVGAMRWAISITNANARHITSNINQIQSHISDSVGGEPPSETKRKPVTKKVVPPAKVPGPSIDPVGTQPN